MALPAAEHPLAGFWMGGFEGADHVNAGGTPLDLYALSGHLDQIEADHRRAAEQGLSCVRESIGWRLAEDGSGRIDLTRALRIAHSARQNGLQVLWTLMHYGVPDGLSLHDDTLIPRFARFAAQVARVLGGASERAPVYTPINEINFLAWAASQPDLLAAPHHTPPSDDEVVRTRGYAVKRRLVQAALAGMAAMRAVDPRCRFLHVEPLVHVVAPAGQPDLATAAQGFCEWQWQAWDMLSGRQEPQLGGTPEALDLLGVNHYHDSQWELHTQRRLDWHTRDPRRRPLSQLLAETATRYGRPVLVAETGHVGSGRADWLHEMAAEARRALQAGTPLIGLCLYPLTDRPDWGHSAHWHRSGLWHVDDAAPGLPRVMDADYARALQQWQHELPTADTGIGRRRPVLLVYTHLRWDFAAHRTRHLMERLAEHWRIVVVEEPVLDPGPARLENFARGPRIEVLRPHSPVPDGGFSSAQQAQVAPLLTQWLNAAGLVPAVQWLSTPMALALARAVNATAPLVYDCADELAGFDGAPLELPACEAQALHSAALVLAAGPSLQRTRAAMAGRAVHLVANGVAEPAPAGAAGPRDWASSEAWRYQGGLPGPRLGYAGAVDDRVDTDLLAELADARPQWQFVLLGPVLKRDPAALPRRPNLHWLGAQPSSTVPAFMAGWSIGLLPFHRSLATVHANPLKVLEYLAAGLPVVSTPLADLEPLRQAGMCLAPDAAAFLHACEGFLAEPPGVAAERQGAARYIVSNCNWADAARQAHFLLAGLR